MYALEEAGLISVGEDSDTKRGRRIGSEENRATGGGPLDISWLNARAHDNVGKGMEKELWAQARELVQKFQGQAIPAGEDTNVEKQGKKDHAMEIDNPDD